MNTAELKAYVDEAKRLESALFTTKRLGDGVTKLTFYEKAPVEPKKPLRPSRLPSYSSKTSSESDADSFVVFIVSLFISLLGAVLLRSVAFFVGMLLIIAIAYATVWVAKIKPEQEAEKEKERKAEESHKQEIEEYENYINNIYPVEHARWEKEKAAFDERAQKYAEGVNNLITNTVKSEYELRNQLTEHYNKGVIHPKYQNLVAVSAISEYLETGRCDSLDGANGAYNLYETELRQNIIIGQLSSIVNNIAQIKNNQFTLYQELLRSNQTVEAMLANISDTTAVNAYFAEIAAAPKETIGIIM